MYCSARQRNVLRSALMRFDFARVQIKDEDALLAATCGYAIIKPQFVHTLGAAHGALTLSAFQPFSSSSVPSNGRNASFDVACSATPRRAFSSREKRAIVAEFDPDGRCTSGPPREHRFSANSVRAWCEQARFEVLGQRQQSPEHYMLLLQAR